MIDDSTSVMVNVRKGMCDFGGFNETCPKVFHEHLHENMPKAVQCDGKEKLV